MEILAEEGFEGVGRAVEILFVAGTSDRRNTSPDSRRTLREGDLLCSATCDRRRRRRETIDRNYRKDVALS